MASVMKAMEAKSDQLNYVDIGESEINITITEVQVKNTPEQPVWIYYDGCNNRPYKPSKGMIRLLAAGWGDESDCWAGKSIKLYGDATVKWAGQEQGGIRIRAMSDIAPNGFDAFVALSRGKRRKVHVNLLEVQLTENDKLWITAVLADPTALDQIEDPVYRARIEQLTK